MALALERTDSRGADKELLRLMNRPCTIPSHFEILSPCIDWDETGSDSLMRLYLRHYRLVLDFQEPWRPSRFPAATLRGGFGYAFKRVTCALLRQECSHCLLRENCPYIYVFETQPPAQATMMRRYQTIPHPYVLGAPLRRGSSLEVPLTLVGRAIPLLPYFVVAFQRLGRKGLGANKDNFELGRVLGLDADGAERELFFKDEERLNQSEMPDRVFDLAAVPDESPVGRLRLELRQPLRIKHGERLLRGELPFHALIRNLLRRASSLSSAHCGGDWSQVRFRSWIEKAETVEIVERELRWAEPERFSTRQKVRMKLGGMRGEILYQGEIEPFLPLLRLGELVHAGKGTSFGLGEFSIVESDGKEAA